MNNTSDSSGTGDGSFAADSYEQERARYLQLFHADGGDGRSGREEELRTTPLLSLKVKHAVDGSTASKGAEVFPQTGLLGYDVGDATDSSKPEPILFNLNAPNSIFLCGQQGAGKSYSLTCLLENCLQDSNVSDVTAPVAGIVFHYDKDSNTLAEAASLASAGIPVKVLVSPSNYITLHRLYRALPGSQNIEVERLLFQDRHLSIKRMHNMMAFSDQEGSMPLYMEVIQRLLRDMATKGEPFKFGAFKIKLREQNFAPGQENMLNMRMGLLESFCSIANSKNQKDVFKLLPGTLTIVDLSDAMVPEATACMLFDACLSLFKENLPKSGLVVALDEAHRYLDNSSAAENFTARLVTTIREQRHNATRVIISTQEPTISEKLMDLCSVSIVHRFSSPAWFAAIKDHLAGASSMTRTAEEQKALFEEIVGLKTGQSLVFASSSFVRVVDGEPMRLGASVMKMQTRRRLGEDAGKSVLATGN